MYVLTLEFNRTTTALTSSLSTHISLLLNLSASNKIVDFLVRAFFFSLNLVFNAAMWALFTAALTRGDSTTRVSIINVSANFGVTAVLGWVIFGEELKGLWFLGAALLVAGNVVIGLREGENKQGKGTGRREGGEGEREGRRGEEEEDLLNGDGDGDLVDLDEITTSQAGDRDGIGRGEEENERVKKGSYVDDPL